LIEPDISSATLSIFPLAANAGPTGSSSIVAPAKAPPSTRTKFLLEMDMVSELERKL
jgi:hypothetical protein